MSEKSPLNENWDSLVDDWQTQPYEKVDMTKLVKQLRRRTLGAYANLALDIVATIFLFVACYWVSVNEPEDRATIIYLAIGGVGSLIYTIFEIKIRLATWKMDATSPSEYFEKNMSALRGSVRFANVWLVSCYIMLPIINWYVWELGKTTEKNINLAYLLANFFVVVLIVLGMIFKRRRKSELSRLEEFKGE